MSPPCDLSVVVTVRKAGARLEETLEALRSQRLDLRWEVLVLDATRGGLPEAVLHMEANHWSGALQPGAGLGPRSRPRIVRAAPGLTDAGLRNAALEAPASPLIVLLDAETTPAAEDLLARLLAPLRCDARVAVAQATQEPHADCDALGRRLLAERAKRLAALPAIVRIGDGEAGWEEWRAHAPSLCLLSLSCAAVRRAAWLEEPVPEAPPIDEERFAFSLLEAGWSIARVPEARAIRSFSARPKDLLRALRAPAAARGKWLRPAKAASLPTTEGRQGGSAILTAAARLAHGGARAAEVLRDQGARAVLQRLRRRAGAEDALAAEGGLSPPPEGGSWWEQHPWPLVREPRRQIPPPRAAALSGPLRICWVVPAFHRGAGGHNTIFRLVAGLERLGHTCEIVFTSHEGLLPASGVQVRNLVRAHYQPIEARCQNWHGGPLPEADVHVATHWDTAFVVDRRRRSGAGAYLVQDWEPGFFPEGTGSALAQETYGLGLFHITAGPWLEARLLHAGCRAARFELAVDPAEYFRAEASVPATTPAAIPKDGRVAVYLRPMTPRRGFELVALALSEVQKQRPALEIAVYGCPPSELKLPFRAETMGVLAPAALRALYNASTAGLSCSLTNYSLVPQEMMACGLPLVEADVPSTRAVFTDGEDALLAPPTPLGLAGALLRLLGDPSLQSRLRENGLRRVRGLTWERSVSQVEAALRTAVAAALGVSGR